MSTSDVGALSINRKPGQGIILDGNIEIRVQSIRGQQVRLLVLAPKSIPIMRNEFTLAAPPTTLKNEQTNAAKL